MRIKQLTKTPLLIIGLALLVGCTLTLPNVSQTPSETTNSTNSDTSIIIGETSFENLGGYYQPTSFIYNNQALGKTVESVTLNAVGNQKILVVPVTFTNYASLATPAMRTSMQKTFFGAASETGWESVSSFYEKSSYGQLKLTGEVTDYFNSGMTTLQLSQKPTDDNDYWDATHYIIEQIYNTFTASKFKEYDQDNDGHIDALWMVYMAPIGVHNSDVFWAYQYYWNHYPNTEKPTPNVYAWASYEFMADGIGYTYDKPDAHTFIHETGHVLGLEDYYDYNGKTAPAGGVDMMDYNIVDHNMYSKFFYNWAQPFVVTDDATITLRPAEATGDFVLLNLGWNGHQFDEYLLFEFYTPTGLNEQDSVTGYGSKGSSISRGFTENGVRIYHVDARIMKVRSSKKTWTDVIVGDSSTYTSLGNSNTPDKDHLSGILSQKLIHLLNAAGSSNDWLNRNTLATNSALFKNGATIAANEWGTYLRNDGKFNDGSAIGFSFEITALSASGATLSFNKI